RPSCRPPPGRARPRSRRRRPSRASPRASRPRRPRRQRRARRRARRPPPSSRARPRPATRKPQIDSLRGDDYRTSDPRRGPAVRPTTRNPEDRGTMTERKATNIVWHAGNVNRADREKINGHKGCTVWFTGLSGSGKSTIAVAVEKALWDRGVRAYILDGDNIRHGLNSNLGFSPEDRTENIRRIGEVAKLFTDAGLCALTAFISPYRADRDKVRALMGA